jgi:hypothetical protein
MPCLRVMSRGWRLARWIWMPLRAWTARPLTVTCMSPAGGRRMPHSTAAGWWLSSAPSPHAATAAIAAVSGVSSGPTT